MQLRLSLKKHWFELTKSNQKKEEYREITEYWFKRLVYEYKKVYDYCTGRSWDNDDKETRTEAINYIARNKAPLLAFNSYQNNIMTLGYPKNDDKERFICLEHKGITIDVGVKELGAEGKKKCQ